MCVCVCLLGADLKVYFPSVKSDCVNRQVDMAHVLLENLRL